jgi:AcrR family transcriptional regulator
MPKAPGVPLMARQAPAGRTLRLDARRNRQLVLDAAEKVFAAKGPSVPIDEIAARAGVGIGTVYRHFPTKEALFEAIIRLRFSRLVEEAHARTSAPGKGKGEAFFAFFARMVEEGTAKRDLVDALTRAGIDVKASILEGARELRQAVGVLLSRAQEEGAVRSDIDTDDVMDLLTGLIRALEGRGRSTRGAEAIISVVFDGLRPPLRQADRPPGRAPGRPPSR